MRGLGDLPIRWKLLLLMLIVGVLPIVISAGLMLRDSRDLVDDSARSLLEARADALASKLDDFHASVQRATDRLALLPQVREFFLEPPAAWAKAEPQMAQILEAYAAADQRLRGVALFTVEGTAVAATEPRLLGNNYGYRSFLKDGARGSGGSAEMYISGPEVGRVPSIAYAAPVRSGSAIVGVAVLFARAAAVWQLVAAGGGGDGSYSVVLDQYGVRIAHSASTEKVFHPAGRLPPEEIDRMVAERRYGEATRTLLEQPLQLEGAFERARGGALASFFDTMSEAHGQAAMAVSKRLSQAPWTVFHLVPRAALQAPVERIVSQAAFADTLVLLVALLFGVLWSRRILKPIAALSNAATLLQRGDLHTRVPEEGRDELARLGAAFNEMAATLAASQQELERQVQRRTEALAAAKADVEKQNAALAQRTAEMTERQARDLAFARTLAALSGQGTLRGVMASALAEAEDYLHSLVLACYRVDGEMVAPVAARGGEPHAMPLTARIKEAFASRKPVLVDALPDEAELRFDAGLAAGKPKCVLLVPLTMGDRDLGLLAAGLAKGPSAQQIAFLVELALPLALAIGRHELHEQTERFALQLAQRNEVLREQSEQLALKQSELEQKNSEIARANDLKSEFLANMSHELRTPLNAVIGFSELLLEDQQKLLPDHVQFAKDILASGRHLLTLINSVLDLAKIESGRVTLEVQRLDPKAQIVSACTLVSALAQRKNIEIEQAVQSRRSAIADRSKLQQILLNLLSNAIKFSEAGTRIEVGVADQGEVLRFWVKDQGPGIPENVRPELFKPFVQGESPLSKSHEGTGLGLAITRRLVEYQGGDVGVDTEVGRGSTFWFTLPADERAAPPGPAVAAVQGEPTNGVPGVLEKPLLLVVEDDPSNMRLMRFHLESAGYAVAEAKREQEALEMTRRLRPKLILLDLILPDGEDGLAVLRELKSKPETAPIPVVVVSVVQETRRARELGAAECFVKPVDAPKLLEVVQRLCPTQAAPPARATVLVVDDHDLNRELARTLLERRGCRVLLARNGQEGTRVAKVERPDLVLMDLAMPVKDGITAARELKADPETSQIPLIAFTALAMRGDEERARKAGFDGYLTKPLEPHALDAALEKFLTPQARA